VYGITDLLTFVLGTIFIVVLPGPNSVFVLTSASMRGIAPGYWAAFGVFVGDTILMVLASVGAASVLYANPTLFMVLKYVGAAYLAWIGIGLLRQAWRGWFRPAALAQSAQKLHINAQATELPEPGQQRPSYGAPFRGALLISLLNPKAIFFFISFFVQFVDPTYAYPALTFLLLGIIVQIFSLAYLAVLIHGGAHLSARMRRYPRINALSAALVGMIFIAFGLTLAEATLS
jgi:leucine efflux protein